MSGAWRPGGSGHRVMRVQKMDGKMFQDLSGEFGSGHSETVAVWCRGAGQEGLDGGTKPSKPTVTPLAVKSSSISSDHSRELH
jgi:hypothetical protein